MTIKATCFDLDGTLLQAPSIDEAVAIACSRVAAIEPRVDPHELARANAELFAALWIEVEEKFYAGLEGDEISRDVWSRSLRACGCDDVALLDAAFEAFSSHVEGAYCLFEDASLLRDLTGNLPLALITNGPSRTQRRKLELMGIEKAFDAVLISGEIGAFKPDPVIFRHAVGLLDTEPESILHVGDSLSADIAGALGVGMTAAWLRTGRRRGKTDPVPHHEIASLLELGELRRR